MITNVDLWISTYLIAGAKIMVSISSLRAVDPPSTILANDLYDACQLQYQCNSIWIHHEFSAFQVTLWSHRRRRAGRWWPIQTCLSRRKGLGFRMIYPPKCGENMANLGFNLVFTTNCTEVRQVFTWIRFEQVKPHEESRKSTRWSTEHQVTRQQKWQSLIGGSEWQVYTLWINHQFRTTNQHTTHLSLIPKPSSARKLAEQYGHESQPYPTRRDPLVR